MTDIEKERLKRINFSVHESGHIVAACSRGLAVDAEIRVTVEQIGRIGAMTWHYGGTIEDDLFILSAGIATTAHFGLGALGTLKDVRNIEEIAAPESAKRQAQDDANAFISGNTEIVLKMAYALFSPTDGRLDQETTRKIYDGEINVTVPQDFLDALDRISHMTWQLVKT